MQHSRIPNIFLQFYLPGKEMQFSSVSHTAYFKTVAYVLIENVLPKMLPNQQQSNYNVVLEKVTFHN